MGVMMSPDEIANEMMSTYEQYADIQEEDEEEHNSIEDALEEEKKESEEQFLHNMPQNPLEAVNQGFGRFEAVEAERDQSMVTIGVVPNIKNKVKDTVIASQVFSQGEQANEEDGGNAMGVIINPQPFSSVLMGLAATMQDDMSMPDMSNEEEKKM